MAFILDQPIAAALFSLTASLKPIDLIEIVHPEMTTLRFASSRTQVTFQSEVYSPRAVNIKTPNEGRVERNNRCDISNTDLGLSTLIRLRNVRPKPRLTHHVVDLDDPTMILAGPFAYDIDSVSHTRTSEVIDRPVRFNLLVPDIRRVAYPGKTYNTVDFPGLR